jgi:hypothetical protein
MMSWLLARRGCRAPQAGDGINNAKVVVDVDKCGVRREREMEDSMIKRWCKVFEKEVERKMMQWKKGGRVMQSERVLTRLGFGFWYIFKFVWVIWDFLVDDRVKIGQWVNAGRWVETPVGKVYNGGEMPANVEGWRALIAIICALIRRKNWDEKFFSTLFRKRKGRAYHPVKEPYDTRTGFAPVIHINI